MNGNGYGAGGSGGIGAGSGSSADYGYGDQWESSDALGSTSPFGTQPAPGQPGLGHSGPGQPCLGQPTAHGQNHYGSAQPSSADLYSQNSYGQPMYGQPQYGQGSQAPDPSDQNPYGPTPYTASPAGAPLSVDPYAGAYPTGTIPRRNPLALLSLIFSLAGLVTNGLTAIVGIILGHIARSQIRRTQEAGAGMALAGMLVGYGLIAVIVLGFLIILIAHALQN